MAGRWQWPGKSHFHFPCCYPPPGCLVVAAVLGSFGGVGCVNRTCLVAITSPLPALPITATAKWPVHPHCYQTACNDGRGCENGNAPPPLCTLPTCLLAHPPSSPFSGKPQATTATLCSAHPFACPPLACQGLFPAAPSKLSLWRIVLRQLGSGELAEVT